MVDIIDAEKEQKIRHECYMMQLKNIKIDQLNKEITIHCNEIMFLTNGKIPEKILKEETEKAFKYYKTLGGAAEIRGM